MLHSHRFFKISYICTISLCICTLFAIAGCQPPPEPECIDAGVKNVVTSIPVHVKKKVNREGDYCQTCIMSQGGYISCQRVWQEKGESREALKKRSKEKSCKDAGFAVDACPESKIMSSTCKGDKTADSPNTAKATKQIQKMILDKKTPPAPKPAPTENKTDKPKTNQPVVE